MNCERMPQKNRCSTSLSGSVIFERRTVGTSARDLGVAIIIPNSPAEGPGSEVVCHPSWNSLQHGCDSVPSAVELLAPLLCSWIRLVLNRKGLAVRTRKRD